VSQDLGEDVSVGLTLEAGAGGAVEGQLLIPGEEGGVRITGKWTLTHQEPRIERRTSNWGDGLTPGDDSLTPLGTC
jgi:hypothetical protein